MTLTQLQNYAKDNGIDPDADIEVLGYKFEQVAQLGLRDKKKSTKHIIMIPTKAMQDVLFQGISNIQNV